MPYLPIPLLTWVGELTSGSPSGFSYLEARSDESIDYSSLRSAGARRTYYIENGYVVRPRLLRANQCEHAVASFREEVKPYTGYLYRQASANPERHRFDASRNILNSLLNPVSVNSRRFPRFRAASETLLCDDKLFAAAGELLNEGATLVQSMYFEANPATWPHQDCYYLDSDRPGELIGAWIALEDIEEAAGRFYVVPGSHRMEIGRNQGYLNIAAYHEQYKKRVYRAIREQSLELRAPRLRCGDVLFWSSRTIHGALQSKECGYTRNSITGHFIPSASKLMRYQCIPVSLKSERIGRNAMCRPKDQNRILNQWMMAVESTVPRVFRFAKRKVISWKINRLAP